MKTCLFCPNPVNSGEHLWSDWIIEDLKLATSIRITIGKASRWQDDPGVKIECVCSDCNNGWMSRLEEASKPAIQAMINDEPLWLSKKDQIKLSRWALLKAMVVDSVKEGRPLFYGDQEKQQIKGNSGIPMGTHVWLGRLSSKQYHAGGTDVWRPLDGVPKALHFNVTNFVMGHLVIQTLSAHILEQFARREEKLYCKNGQWHVNLLYIFPFTTMLQWPPNLSFTLERTQDSIVTLLDRWKLGQNIGD